MGISTALAQREEENKIKKKREKALREVWMQRGATSGV